MAWLRRSNTSPFPLSARLCSLSFSSQSGLLPLISVSDNIPYHSVFLHGLDPHFLVPHPKVYGTSTTLGCLDGSLGVAWLRRFVFAVLWQPHERENVHQTPLCSFPHLPPASPPCSLSFSSQSGLLPLLSVSYNILYHSVLLPMVRIPISSWIAVPT
ncbi:hypothetical protein DFH08DRAFT_881766 [Mycena albidolilacea]|uniref:Uncharacterized protein n=1 Tax=Mycena albidolilacea TaxID=1033008 RepID=A0AAD6ZDR5_9AGAR|nr:hypothetical protein DFH08DRAFT_891881 [Mycena albidolilacea]KAJ7331541.1 hypothetical protein DFH08DRAFT_881766 [Mycena albidolilacea]